MNRKELNTLLCQAMGETNSKMYEKDTYHQRDQMLRNHLVIFRLLGEILEHVLPQEFDE